MQDRPLTLQDLTAREAIRDCIASNALACDLLDVEAWKSTYWPDAEESYIWTKGNAHAFARKELEADN